MKHVAETLLQLARSGRSLPPLPEEYKYEIGQYLGDEGYSYRTTAKWVLIHLECMKEQNQKKFFWKKNSAEIVGVYVVMKEVREQTDTKTKHKSRRTYSDSDADSDSSYGRKAFNRRRSSSSRSNSNLSTSTPMSRRVSRSSTRRSSSLRNEAIEVIPVSKYASSHRSPGVSFNDDPVTSEYSAPTPIVIQTNTPVYGGHAPYQGPYSPGNIAPSPPLSPYMYHVDKPHRSRSREVSSRSIDPTIEVDLHRTHAREFSTSPQRRGILRRDTDESVGSGRCEKVRERDHRRERRRNSTERIHLLGDSNGFVI